MSAQLTAPASAPGFFERLEHGLDALSAKANAIGATPAAGPLYNFDNHEAERFAYRLASSAGEYGTLDSLGHSSQEGKRLIAELAMKHLEEERGLEYHEDPIGAVLRLSGLGRKLLENNLRFQDATEFRWKNVRSGIDPERIVGSALDSLTAELGRTFRETFHAREGSPRHGIWPLAANQTVERLAASAGAEIISQLATERDPAKLLDLQLTVLRKAGLIERP